jgi:beta-lactamase class D
VIGRGFVIAFAAIASISPAAQPVRACCETRLATVVESSIGVESSTLQRAPTTGLAECFLLFEIGVGPVRRNPDAACGTRLSPASTFKIPHALAALDAGVVSGPNHTFKWDGVPRAYESWRRDHTLASAMHNSVLWYFQRIAEKLGMTRERDYLRRFNYGNMDPSSGLTTFWLGGSLLISPDEQLRFLRRLYVDALPVSLRTITTVKRILVQPRDVIVNATGQHPFAAPWPADAIVSAKTGSATDRQGKAVRWIVGHVRRAPRAWLFVSAVTGGDDDVPALAAVDLAAKALSDQHVLR